MFSNLDNSSVIFHCTQHDQHGESQSDQAGLMQGSDEKMRPWQQQPALVNAIMQWFIAPSNAASLFISMSMLAFTTMRSMPGRNLGSDANRRNACCRQTYTMNGFQKAHFTMQRFR